MITERTVAEFAKSVGLDATQIDAVTRFLKDVYMKDTLPNNGARDPYGYLYENGPFTHIEGDIFSSVISGGSVLANWIPSRKVTHRFDNIKHLDWVAPEGFDGSQTYADWLNGQTIAECDFGPATSWNGFEYQQQGGSFSWSTGNMRVIPDGGLSYYETSPVYTIRGFSRQQVSSDREWAVARVLFAMEAHLDWVLANGNRTNSQMEWDGLETILSENYVLDRVISPTNSNWAKPITINGASITTAAGLLQQLRKLIRLLRNRLQARNIRPAFGDMVIYMGSTMFDNIAESIASGNHYTHSSTGSQFVGNIMYQDFVRNYEQIKSTRTIDIDGEPILVLVDPNVGMNVTLDPSGTPAPAVTGPVKVLTRRAGGDVLLEQNYIDYNQMNYPTNGTESTFNLFGGVVRAGWLIQNNQCYKYYAEMGGRLLTRGQQYQGVITNVTIPTLADDEHEGYSFTSPDFYAFGRGNQGGYGTGYLNSL